MRHRGTRRALAEGRPIKRNKYRNTRSGKYASLREERCAISLHALAKAGGITDLREQVSYTLVPGSCGIMPVRYVADFVYKDPGGATHVCDAKGYSNQVYRLKKKMMLLVHKIAIEEL